MSGKEAPKRLHNSYDEVDDDRPRKIPKTLVEKDSQRRLIVILEKANLETVKVCKKRIPCRNARALLQWCGSSLLHDYRAINLANQLSVVQSTG